MQPNQQTTQLLNQTIDTFNGDVQAISPTDGVSLIDNWISALHSGDASTNPIASTLSELKVELQRGNPDAQTIQALLEQLANQANEAGEVADGAAQSALTELSSALQSFSQQLGGESGPAKTGGQAPMTSTTTNQSTQGTYATDIDMDDQTGSNAGATGESGSENYARQSPDAGNTQGGGSYGSGYGTGSSGEDETQNSGTERSMSADMDDNASRARLEGDSTSSGSDDTDTGASSPGAGGRMPVM
ncbi:hypothetical protein [Rudanella lutea]|uniref:hypothetical protein n=1 Tax=Rudanella lutea TaxID=451374 RepID=UPI0003630303|nr:hypothetical protein [Rudanella lutea]